MNRKIFINLPVEDLPKSIAFFTKLGFGFNADFTDATAACMVVSEDIFVMLLTREKFASFTPRAICNATQSTEVLLCLSCETRSEVDTIVHNAIAAGGATHREPQDHGFMYEHAFQDPDGHIWEVVHMASAA
ncbi:MAG: VOC family protein [Thiohalobacteraceae bacterium]